MRLGPAPRGAPTIHRRDRWPFVIAIFKAKRKLSWPTGRRFAGNATTSSRGSHLPERESRYPEIAFKTWPTLRTPFPRGLKKYRTGRPHASGKCLPITRNTKRHLPCMRRFAQNTQTGSANDPGESVEAESIDFTTRPKSGIRALGLTTWFGSKRGSRGSRKDGLNAEMGTSGCHACR